MKFGVILLILMMSFSAACGQARKPANDELSPLPVICYHRFGPEKKGDGYLISKERFEEQLIWLKENGYSSVSLRQIKAYTAGKTKGLPEKPVCISIDDGYRSGLTRAAPLLKKHGFSAVYFITSEQIGASKSFFSIKDLKKLEKDGFEIALHSGRHSNLAKPLKTEDPAQYQRRLFKEIDSAKKDIEKMLGHKIIALSYPYGAYNEKVVRQCREAGFELGFSVTDGSNLPDINPFKIRRILLQGPVGLKSFAKRVLLEPLDIVMVPLLEGRSFEKGEQTGEIEIRGLKDTKGLTIYLKKEKMVLEKRGGSCFFSLPKDLKKSFYLLRIRKENGNKKQGQNYLFQILAEGQTKYFK